MDKTKFQKAWSESGLAEHYNRIDFLKLNGFSFDIGRYGELRHAQSKALHDWLDSHEFEKITDPSETQLMEAIPSILTRAKAIQKQLDDDERNFDDDMCCI